MTSRVAIQMAPQHRRDQGLAPTRGASASVFTDCGFCSGTHGGSAARGTAEYQVGAGQPLGDDSDSYTFPGSKFDRSAVTGVRVSGKYLRHLRRSCGVHVNRGEAVLVGEEAGRTRFEVNDVFEEDDPVSARAI
ncbi:hypothetical protein PsYK624_168180 [Phanerochaete sordida]|uniref:Uncharacterized protein n=1 Tax=Phanerochaete sordida TaxID=48140 RepID=A0A9P3LMK7_9APHY|nr:hypothetical protein PsYK624_168180 [Phanerochaete sordida]